MSTEEQGQTMPGINKDIGGEVTVVVPPSKASKLSRGHIPDAEGDVPMENVEKDEVDVAQAEKIKAIAGKSRPIEDTFLSHCLYSNFFSQISKPISVFSNAPSPSSMLGSLSASYGLSPPSGNFSPRTCLLKSSLRLTLKTVMSPSFSWQR